MNSWKATDTVVQRLWAVMREFGNFRHDVIPDRLAPTEAERGMLAGRLDQVSHHLTPAKAAAIKRSVGMVKGLMASATVGGQSAGAILDGYAMVLAPYPQAGARRTHSRAAPPAVRRRRGLARAQDG